MRAALVLLILFAGCLSAEPPAEPGPGEAAPSSEPNPELLAHLQAMASFPEVRFETDHGDIRLLLYTEWLPITTDHIAALVGRGFYDGTIIHRVVDDFVIQGGDPTGTGEGGSGPAGTPDEIPLEIKEGLQFGSGAVGLARWTEDTGDSQWFITEKPALHLNDPQGATGDVFGAYALFAQVFEGMDVVRQIAAVQTIPQADRPIEDVLLLSASLLPAPADVSLLNIVPTVVQEPTLASGMFEAPRYAIAGQVAQFTLSIDTPRDAIGRPDATACAGWDYAATIQQGDTRLPITWSETADPCTKVGSVVPPHAGAWGVASSAAVTSIDVLPWHDAYLPFLGPVA